MPQDLIHEVAAIIGRGPQPLREPDEHRPPEQREEWQPDGQFLATLAVALSRAHVHDFTQYDWYGLLGAERFEDGSEPKMVHFHAHDLAGLMRAMGIADWPADMVQVVLDKGGLTFNGDDAEGYGAAVTVRLERVA